MYCACSVANELMILVMIFSSVLSVFFANYFILLIFLTLRIKYQRIILYKLLWLWGLPPAFVWYACDETQKHFTVYTIVHFTDIPGDRCAISTDLARVWSGWTTYSAWEQKLILMIVSTTAGDSTTADTVRMCQSPAALVRKSSIMFRPP